MSDEETYPELPVGSVVLLDDVLYRRVPADDGFGWRKEGDRKPSYGWGWFVGAPGFMQEIYVPESVSGTGETP